MYKIITTQKYPWELKAKTIVINVNYKSYISILI